MVYAGENGTSRSANKKTQYGNFAPRLGITYEPVGDASHDPAHRLRHHLLPEPARGRQHRSASTCRSTISQNVSTETNPLDFSTRADDRRSVPADRPGQAADDRGAERRQPARARATGSRTRRRTPSSGTSASSGSSFPTTARSRSSYAGSAGKHLVLCYNPNEVQPGPGSQASRRLLQPIASVSNMLQCDPRNRSTYHAGS